ncbi:T9SS type A sorting domain-containing protein [Chryseobacterium sp. POL2]|uniref:T9SS type A sorting domain-containing protein n=1 Tax=Chryseobacterium sp. POL2 TaxID=2713414 RepID=UPI0013E1C723|nr:T9SS type A sorting domain-containing protein [Chryseobacterium sp. POL2]QIG89574.1 T9SS type A sorting domain-containing protein [Chryseobacterium sp. POL2]
MKRQIFTLGLLLTVGLINAQTANSNNVFYVKQGASTANSAGNSWENAHGDLGAVLAKAKQNGTVAKIYVAKGTYSPTRDKTYNVQNANNRDLSFRIPHDVSVYGGFNPEKGIVTESQRNFSKDNETILSGAYNNAAYYYNVVVVQETDFGTLDGVSIVNGKADGTNSANGLFRGFGGAVHVKDATLNILNSRFYNNYAVDRGGAIYAERSNAKITLINTEIYNNKANGDGSAVYLSEQAKAYIVNSTIVKNASENTSNGGALHVRRSGKFYVYNTILWNNTKGGGGLSGMSGGSASDFVMRNSIVNNNTANYYGEQYRNLVYHEYPQFTDYANNDFSLKSTSYAIDKGKVSYLDENGGGNTRDLNGNPRKNGTRLDIGAYQNQKPFTFGSIVYVNPNATGGNGSGNSWENALPNLADLLQLVNFRTEKSATLIPGSTNYQDNFAGTTIYVAKGQYQPIYNAFDFNLDADPKKTSFLLSKNVKIYGSFDPENGIITLAQRNMNSSLSELYGPNRKHVVIAAGAKSTGAVLDGFKIRGGNADGGDNMDVNGQSLSSKFGGGLMIQGAKIKTNKLIFTGNKALERGSAIYVEKSDGELVISNSLLHNNEPSKFDTTLEGSAIYLNDNAVAKVINTTVANNLSNSDSGGALHVKAGGKFYIYNTISWNNINTSQKLLNLTGGSSNSSNFEVYNSIINANSNPDGEGGNGHNNGDNAGKINFRSFNPLFVNSLGGNYTLQQLSSAINQGDNNYYTTYVGSIPDQDIFGKSRVVDGTIDIGAFENEAPIKPDVANTLYVKKDATGTGNGSNWINAFNELADALKWANQQSSFKSFTAENPLKIKVASGTYEPLYNPANLERETDTKNRSFVMVKNVHVSGSYDPTTGKQTSVLGDKKTVLNGTNSYHLVIAAGENSNNSVLESFQLQNSTANGTNSYNVNGHDINRDKGAGVYVVAENSSKPVHLYLKNIVANNNKANERGGFVYADRDGSNLYMFNTLAYDNVVANGTEGGSVVFSNNKAKVNIINSTIADNKSNNAGGGALHVADNGTFNIQNSIIWNNKNKSNVNANMTGGIDANFVVNRSIMNKDGNHGNDSHDNGENNGKINFLIYDPEFKDAINRDYSLDSTNASPALDQGDYEIYKSLAKPFTGEDYDIAANPRLFGKLDLGAIENQSENVIKPSADNTLYVKKGATGNGSDWNNPVGELADALKWINQRIDPVGKLTIKVAKGTYTPKYNAVDFNKYSAEVDKTFLMVKNVHIYGGYDPDNGSQRNTQTAQTILSGNDKSYHVVVSAGDKDADVNVFSKLDGVTITGGKANGLGGATINGEGINQHYGAGIYADNTRLKIHSSIFKNNESITGSNGNYGRAAALYAEGNSDIVLSNSLLFKNKIDGEGSAIYANDGDTSVKIVNTTIVDNLTTSSGPTGAVHIANGADYYIQNCIVWNNRNKNGFANLTGGDSNDYGWNVNNSIINRKSNLVGDGDGHNDGENGGRINFKSYDPKFVDAANEDYSLQPTSSAINAGDKNYYLAVGSATDLDVYGNTRIKENSIDIGAIESIKSVAKNPIALYVDSNVSSTSDKTGDTWANAMPNLADALQWVSRMNNTYTAQNPLKIYVAKGTQKPMYSYNTKTYRNDQGRPSSDDDNEKIDSDFEVDINGDKKKHAFFIPNNVIVYGNYNPVTGIQEKGDAIPGTILSGAVDKNHHIIVTSKSNGKNVVASLENVIIEGADAVGEGNVNGIAHYYGGGVYAEDATINLKNVVVRNNKSDERGAGLYAEKNAKINVVNSILHNNVSNGDGSAMYSNDYALIKVVNSTIVNNTSNTNENGGALHVKAKGKFEVYNSILWNNKRKGGVITNLTGGNETYFTIANTVMNPGSTPHLSNNINYFTFDPEFEDVDNNDFRLKSTSEAIDRGNNDDYIASGNDINIDLDVLGNKRLENLVIDLGAYEYFKDSSLSTVDNNTHATAKVYPNPTSGVFIIDSPQQETVAIYNITGQFIKTINVKVGKNQIDITGLPAGLYIIKAQKSSHKIIKK